MNEGEASVIPRMSEMIRGDGREGEKMGRLGRSDSVQPDYSL